MDQPEIQSGTNAAPAVTIPPVARSSNKKWIIIGVVVLIVLAGIQFLVSTLLNPAKLMELAIEHETGKDIDISRDGATIKGEGPDGSQYEFSTSENLSLPDAWPEFVPVMDGAQIIQSASFGHDQYGQKDGISMLVTFETSESSSKVVAFYKEELAKEGFVLEGESSMRNVSSAMFTKDTERVAIVITKTESSPQNAVQLNYSKQK